MWTNKNLAILGGACAASLAVGSASGYLTARRLLDKAYAITLTEEIRQTKAFYENMAKPDPDALAEMLLESDELPQKHPYDTTSDEVPPEVLERIVGKMAEAEAEVAAEAEPMSDTPHNAFENPAPEWVQADEELERKNGVPYIISHAEFYENQWEFTEGQLTYYEGDDTLADSRDEPIIEQYAAVGEISLDKFGFGSKDPNIVYVCNEKMEMVFEISRSSKSFSEDVLGFQHADNSPRKFRDSRASG